MYIPCNIVIFQWNIQPLFTYYHKEAYTMNQLVQEATELFSKDIFATQVTGIKIVDITDQSVTCNLEITENHKNATGTVMGGVIYTLADFTFAVAANFHKSLTVSLTSEISYLGVARGKQLIATSSCIHEGRTTCYYSIKITDELGNDVAITNITGFIKR